MNLPLFGIMQILWSKEMLPLRPQMIPKNDSSGHPLYVTGWYNISVTKCCRLATVCCISTVRNSKRYILAELVVHLSKRNRFCY